MDPFKCTVSLLIRADIPEKHQQTRDVNDFPGFIKHIPLGNMQLIVTVYSMQINFRHQIHSVSVKVGNSRNPLGTDVIQNSVCCNKL